MNSESDQRNCSGANADDRITEYTYLLASTAILPQCHDMPASLQEACNSVRILFACTSPVWYNTAIAFTPTDWHPSACYARYLTSE